MLAFGAKETNFSTLGSVVSFALFARPFLFSCRPR